MIVKEDPELATKLLQEMHDRQRAAHVSVGNSVASIKQLTQCLRAAWGEKWLGWERPDIRDDEIGLIRVLSGTWFGDLANPDPEERIEIETKYGIISGRIDIQQKIGEEIDFGDGNIFCWGENFIIPGEIKLTWSSPRKVFTDFVQYTNQILGYMVAKNILRRQTICSSCYELRKE